MGYIAEHTGFTGEEVHDVVMKYKWGTRKIELGGLSGEGRRSWTTLTKTEATEMIAYDLELCNELGVHVPSMEELGYISNYS